MLEPWEAFPNQEMVPNLRNEFTLVRFTKSELSLDCNFLSKL